MQRREGILQKKPDQSLTEFEQRVPPAFRTPAGTDAPPALSHSLSDIQLASGEADLPFAPIGQPTLPGLLADSAAEADFPIAPTTAAPFAAPAQDQLSDEQYAQEAGRIAQLLMQSPELIARASEPQETAELSPQLGSLDTEAAAQPAMQLLAGSEPAPAPTNMAQIFDAIQGGGNEILAYRLVDDGDLVILLAGSDPGDFSGVNSLVPNAIRAWRGKDSSYSRALKAMLERLGQAHGGANVHMVGYSQGGIIAQNFMINKQVFAEYGLNLASVSTFGTPEVAPRNRDPQVDTSRNFDAPGDLVSSLGYSKEGGSSLPMPLLLRLASTAVFPFLILPGIYTHINGYKKDTETRQQMEETETPYKPQMWELVDRFQDPGEDD